LYDTMKKAGAPTLRKFGSCYSPKVCPKTHLKSTIMITLFLNNCKTLSQESYNDLIERLDIYRIQCSCHCRGSLIRHGFYSRTLKCVTGTLKLRILRVKCTRCGRTHALLPAELVPYSQVSLYCQINMLRFKINSPEMESMRNANPDLDEGCISRVRRKFRKYWAERLHAEQLEIHMNIGDLVRGCFIAYHKQFLQIRAGVNLLFSVPT